MALLGKDGVGGGGRHSLHRRRPHGHRNVLQRCHASTRLGEGQGGRGHTRTRTPLLFGIRRHRRWGLHSKREGEGRTPLRWMPKRGARHRGVGLLFWCVCRRYRRCGDGHFFLPCTRSHAPTMTTAVRPSTIGARRRLASVTRDTARRRRWSPHQGYITLLQAILLYTCQCTRHAASQWMAMGLLFPPGVFQKRIA